MTTTTLKQSLTRKNMVDRNVLWNLQMKKKQQRTLIADKGLLASNCIRFRDKILKVTMGGRFPNPGSEGL